MQTKYNPLDLNPNIAVGINLPLIYSDTHTFNLNYTTIEQAGTNFLMLILTNEGERVMLPTFGCSLYKYIFEQDTQKTIDAIKNQIITKTSSWLPYINIVDIQHTIELNMILKFNIYWNLKNNNDDVEILSFSVNLN